MSEPSTAELIKIAMLSARRVRARTSGSLWRLPVLRWRYGLPIADRFTVIPSDLHIADPASAIEMMQGQFNFAGRVASLDGSSSSPFVLRPPGLAWERELHGFAWLRHLNAGGGPEARNFAVFLTEDWIKRAPPKSDVAWEPAVLGRRMVSWITHAPLLLEGATQSSYDRITDSLGEQLVELSSRWRECGNDLHRLQSLVSLVTAMLCIARHDAELQEASRMLGEELRAQVFPDGGHLSRNPAVLIDLLLDLLPLRECFKVRNTPAPPELETSTAGMMRMLHLLRLGDGNLARFNGMGETPPEELSTVLAYDQIPVSEAEAPSPPKLARHSKYARLQAGTTVIAIDAGGPPAWDVAGQAHAGCLSFEMSSGDMPLLVNGGAPELAFDDWLMEARATASHNTLCVDGTSSSRMIESPTLEDLAGGRPLRYPDSVEAGVAEDEAGQVFEGRHDGYARHRGLLHGRKIRLSEDGRRVSGLDRLSSRQSVLRLAKDAPFAVHFHLHPSIVCDPVEASDGMQPGRSVLLTLSNGERWCFRSEDLPLSVEASRHYASFRGPLASLQIVLRGATFGESTVRWSLERVAPSAAEA